MRRLIAALTLVGVSLVGRGASAYVRTLTDNTRVPMRWDHVCLPLHILIGDLPNGVTPDIFTRAAEEAAKVWSAADPFNPGTGLGCSALKLSVLQSAATTTFVKQDRLNHVFFRKDSWTRSTDDPKKQEVYDPAALAITSVWARPSDGIIVDTDVEINDALYDWGDRASSVGRFEDLQNTLTHEFGHVIGLDHTCYPARIPVAERPKNHLGVVVPDCESAPAEIRETTMYATVVPGDLSRRTLTADDQLGVCQVYANPTDLSCAAPSPEGGCTFGGGSASDASFLLGVLALGFTARRRFRRPS